MESFSYTVDVGIDVLSKDQLQALLLGSPDIITVFDRNGVILYISPAIEAVTGFAPEELVAQEMLSFVHPYEQRLIRQRFGGLVQAEASKPIQFRFCAKSGKYIWLETVGGNQLTNEALGGVVAYLRDIGERKRMEEQIHLLNHTLEQRVVDRTRELATANEELELQIQDRNTIEAALRENGRLLDLIFTTANIGLAVSDEEGRFVHINPMYCTIVGYESAEQLLGKPYFSLLPLNEEAEARALYGRFITGDDTATLRERTVVRSDGIKLDVLTSAARLVRENGQVFVISALADISERMQAERRLEMALLELKAVYQALPDLYFRLDSEGYYLDYHALSLDDLPAPPEQFLGRHVDKVLPGELADSIMEGMSNARATQGLVSLEYSLASHRRKRFYEARIVPMPAGHSLIVVRDITQRKQREEDLRKALEREKELHTLKSRFIAMVSHEFRTPLTTIRSSAELLARNHQKWTMEKQDQYLRDIGIAVTHMTQMLEEVIYLGKAGSNKITLAPWATDMHELCADIINSIELATDSITADRVIVNIMDIVSNAGNIARMPVVDAKLVRQMLTNLLSNALKYSAVSSFVECDIQYRAENNVEGLPVALILRVSDKGIGMSEEDLKFSLDPFHRGANVGSAPGTGLGLAIVKQSVDLHGGNIEVLSTLDVGTTVTVTIPCTFVS